MEPTSNAPQNMMEPDSTESTVELIGGIRQAYFNRHGVALDVHGATIMAGIVTAHTTRIVSAIKEALAAMKHAGENWGEVTPTLIAMVIYADNELRSVAPYQHFTGAVHISAGTLDGFKEVLASYRAFIGGQGSSGSSSDEDIATSHGAPTSIEVEIPSGQDIADFGDEHGMVVSEDSEPELDIAKLNFDGSEVGNDGHGSDDQTSGDDESDQELGTSGQVAKRELSEEV